MINSKKKGNAFELKIANMLKAKFNFNFRRTPMSGAFGNDLEKAIGDIITPDNFIFTIECKKRESWLFEDLLNEKGKLISFWEQAKSEAEKAGKVPLLLVAKNRSNIYAVMPRSYWIETQINTELNLNLLNAYKKLCYAFDDLRPVPNGFLGVRIEQVIINFNDLMRIENDLFFYKA